MGTFSHAKWTSSPILGVSRRSEDFMTVGTTAEVSTSADSCCAYRDADGHLCIRRTQVQVQRRTYRRGWKSDVRLEVRRCNECAHYHRDQPLRQAELRPVVVGESWERIGIDIMGRHLRTSNGYEYILTAIHHFSKWSEAYPLRDNRIATVTRVLIDQLFSRFEHPVQILSYQGKEFDGQLIHQLCNLMKVDIRLAMAWRNTSIEC